MKIINMANRLNQLPRICDMGGLARRALTGSKTLAALWVRGLLAPGACFCTFTSTCTAPAFFKVQGQGEALAVLQQVAVFEVEQHHGTPWGQT